MEHPVYQYIMSKNLHRFAFCAHELLLDENSLLFTVCIQSHANNVFPSSINKSSGILTLKSLKHYYIHTY